MIVLFSFLVLALFLSACGGGSSPNPTPTPTPGPTPTPAPKIFSPILDTNIDTNLSGLATSSGANHFTLAYVVDNFAGACAPAWENRGTVAADSTIGPAITAFRTSLPGTTRDVTVSFGGPDGPDLAFGCSNATTLQAAYQAVITKYSLTSLDFDIESTADLANTTAIQNRNTAIKNLQTANPGLTVSFTLPVKRAGLDTALVLPILTDAKNKGVTISMVNIRTSDFTDGSDPGTMGANAIAAANATITQLSNNSISASLGITPIIGVNHQATQIFSLADATDVKNFVQSTTSVTTLSMWTVSRDRQCSSNGTYNDTCSGVSQGDWAYSNVFKTIQ